MTDEQRTERAVAVATSDIAGKVDGGTRPETEPAGHGIGCSRGGLTIKVHQAAVEHGPPLAMILTGDPRTDGHAHEARVTQRGPALEWRTLTIDTVGQ